VSTGTRCPKEQRLGYTIMLKTGSMDDAIQKFSLDSPSRYLSHDIMHYKCGKQAHYFLGAFFFSFFSLLYVWDIFSKKVIPLVLLVCELIIANLVLHSLLSVILISKLEMHTSGEIVNFKNYFGFLGLDFL